MKSKYVKIIVALITTAGMAATSYITAKYKDDRYEKELNTQMASISGNGNVIAINTVPELVEEYKKVSDEKADLQAEKVQYQEAYESVNAEKSDLVSQLQDTPVVSFENLGLCINGEDILVDSQKSRVNIDGRYYFAEDFVQKLLEENEHLTIKNGVAYVGRIIADKANLIDQHIVNQNSYMKICENIKDSYGNIYSNALVDTAYNGKIIFNLKRNYSNLKCRISVSEDYAINKKAIVTIKADEKPVYVKEVDKTTEPFTEEGITLNQCSLLTIEIDAGGCGNKSVIISDAVLYN